MKTLIELYDERPFENVLATQVFKPQTTVYVCPEGIDPRGIIGYFKYAGIKTKPVFAKCDVYDTRSLLSCLRSVVLQNEDCALDITGGTDAALFAAGVLHAETGLPAFTYSRRRNTFYSISGAEFADKLPCPLSLKVEDFFVMAGGSVRRGRVDNNVLKNYLGSFDPFFNVYLKHKKDWKNIIGWFQRVSMPVEGRISIHISAPFSVKNEQGGTIRINPDALKELENIGFIKSLSITSDRTEFDFKDGQVRAWLRDIGSVLETYVYNACLKTGLFTDVCTSVIVDWEGTGSQTDVTNELDVMASVGVRPVFISCKATDIKTYAINELKVLTDRFGGKNARSALVTTCPCGRLARRRAEEMGITIIDIYDLKQGRLQSRIAELAEIQK